MSTLDELNESLNNQDKQDDEILENIRHLNLVVPLIEEKRMERNAKRNLINNAPVDFVEEFGPKLLRLEKDDEEKIRVTIPGLWESVKMVQTGLNSTGSTDSTYLAEAYEYAGRAESANSWLLTVNKPFDDLAKYKLQRAEIPQNLNKFQPALGDLFSAALQSTDKAKSELELQSDSIMAMRNFLQSFWGNILERARESKPSIWKGIQKSKLSQAEPRDLVASSLSNNSSDERKLVQLLKNMADLYNEMSDSQVGKNLGFYDLQQHNALFTRWLLLIDNVTKIIQV